MNKKYFFYLIFVFGATTIFAQKANDLSIEKDSVIDNKLGVIYTYKLFKHELSKKREIYFFETQTESVVEQSRYINKHFDFYLYILYDEPTGRIRALIYNYKNNSLFISDWFDDKAKGDYLIKDKVNFSKRLLTIKDKNAKRFYKVKLHDILPR
jgi:hypothetical protein